MPYLIHPRPPLLTMTMSLVLSGCITWHPSKIGQLEMRKNSVRVGSGFFLESSPCFRLHKKPSTDIFTKKMHYGSHFQPLYDSFMGRMSDFLQQSLIEIHLSCQHDESLLRQVMPSAASLSTSFTCGAYLLDCCSSPHPRLVFILCGTLLYRTCPKTNFFQCTQVLYLKSWLIILAEHTRSPIMDVINRNCCYLHILVIPCSQIVYWYLSNVFCNISVYTILFMTANQVLLLLGYHYYGNPVNYFLLVQIYTYYSTCRFNF